MQLTVSIACSDVLWSNILAHQWKDISDQVSNSIEAFNHQQGLLQQAIKAVGPQLLALNTTDQATSIIDRVQPALVQLDQILKDIVTVEEFATIGLEEAAKAVPGGISIGTSINNTMSPLVQMIQGLDPTRSISLLYSLRANLPEAKMASLLDAQAKLFTPVDAKVNLGRLDGWRHWESVRFNVTLVALLILVVLIMLSILFYAKQYMRALIWTSVLMQMAIILLWILMAVHVICATLFGSACQSLHDPKLSIDVVPGYSLASISPVVDVCASGKGDLMQAAYASLAQGGSSTLMSISKQNLVFHLDGFDLSLNVTRRPDYGKFVNDTMNALFQRVHEQIGPVLGALPSQIQAIEKQMASFNVTDAMGKVNVIREDLRNLLVASAQVSNAKTVSDAIGELDGRLDGVLNDLRALQPLLNAAQGGLEDASALVRQDAPLRVTNLSSYVHRFIEPAMDCRQMGEAMSEVEHEVCSTWWNGLWLTLFIMSILLIPLYLILQWQSSLLSGRLLEEPGHPLIFD